MTKTRIREIVSACMNPKRICRTYYRYDPNCRYYIPLIVSDKLFLGTEEDDFILDGYAIRRFRDVTKAEIKEDLCEKILKEEGVFDHIIPPDVDLSSWESVFRSLQKMNRNIIVEKESLDKNEWEYFIGRIEKVCKEYVSVRHFDSDGVWNPEPRRIPYTWITTVTFGSRYVDTFSKYVGEPPITSEKGRSDDKKSRRAETI